MVAAKFGERFGKRVIGRPAFDGEHTARHRILHGEKTVNAAHGGEAGEKEHEQDREPSAPRGNGAFATMEQAGERHGKK